VKHRGDGATAARVAKADIDAWAIIGLGTIAEIARGLELLSETDRRRLWKQAGGLLLEGGGP